MLAVAMSACQAQSLADCIGDAAHYHGVRENILRAILWNESHMNPNAMHRNANGTYDIDIAQINSIHLRELAARGVPESWLLDGCAAAYVAAWHLRRQVDRLGDTWAAVGAYHSNTPAYSQAYANAVFLTLRKAGVQPPGEMPFPKAAKSSAQVAPPPRRTRPAVVRLAGREFG